MYTRIVQYKFIVSGRSMWQGVYLQTVESTKQVHNDGRLCKLYHNGRVKSIKTRQLVHPSLSWDSWVNTFKTSPLSSNSENTINIVSSFVYIKNTHILYDIIFSWRQIVSPITLTFLGPIITFQPITVNHIKAKNILGRFTDFLHPTHRWIIRLPPKQDNFSPDKKLKLCKNIKQLNANQ